jgi:hypothetical protein
LEDRVQRALVDLARQGDEEAFADLSRDVGVGFASWTDLLNSVTFDPRSAK